MRRSPRRGSVWAQAGCRLMALEGLQGVHRRRKTRTTMKDAAAAPAPDLVDRNFAVARCPTACGSATSPTCGPTKDGSTSAPSWTSSRAGSWGGRWPSTCAPSSSPMPSTWPLPPPSTKRPRLSFRSRVSVHQLRLQAPLRRGRNRPVDGIGGRRLRQRHDRELLRHARDRASRPDPLQDTPRRSGRHLRLYRSLLQPPPAALRFSGICRRFNSRTNTKLRCCRPHPKVSRKPGQLQNDYR